MKVSILKVSGPFLTVQEPDKPPVDVWTVRFVVEEAKEGSVSQREGVLNVIGKLDKAKVQAAIKALLEAEKPHPLDGESFEV